MKARVAAAVMVLAASSLFAEDDYRYGRVRYTEPGVTIQRASEANSEEAEPNVPFLPGDRIWTDSGGRAEFQFGDGSLLRLDSRSKLEYLAAEGGRPSVLRLHSGSLMLHAFSRDPGFEVETPAGLVETLDRGVYRVDAEGVEVWLSVFGGEASLAAGRRRVNVAEGERSSARRGEEPDDPQRFDRRDVDDFARWNQDREGRVAWASERREYIPEEVAPYAGELESNGSWYFQVDAGYVWRPYVASGWRPYCHGRWAWTAYGWTWVPQESWGWAPFHYGRWDYTANLGWYWIPGAAWGPAWVHWAVGPSYVGWCPRGYQDRVVPYYDHAYKPGAVRVAGTTGAWNYATRDQMRVGFAARRPVTANVAAADVRRIDAPHGRPGRDLRTIETGTARPSFRAVRLNPTVGDFVPELRSDNRTTIPAPVVRRKPTPRYDRDNSAPTATNTRPQNRPQTRPHSDDGDFTGVDAGVRSQPRRGPRDWPEPSRPRSGDAGTARETRPRGEGTTRRQDNGAPVRSYRPPERSDRSERPDRGERPDSGRPPDSGEARSKEGARSSDPDRDVFRRMFRPLSDTREGAQGSGRSSGGGREGKSSESRPRSSESRPSSGRSEGRSEARPAGAGSRSGGSRSESRPAPRNDSGNKGGGAQQRSQKEHH